LKIFTFAYLYLLKAVWAQLQDCISTAPWISSYENVKTPRTYTSRLSKHLGWLKEEQEPNAKPTSASYTKHPMTGIENGIEDLIGEVRTKEEG
jgi:hypothetical protein